MVASPALILHFVTPSRFPFSVVMIVLMAASEGLDAASVLVNISGGQLPLYPDPASKTLCRQDSDSAALCDIHAYFYDPPPPLAGNEGYGAGTANADFGVLSGSAFGAIEYGEISVFYRASFSDYLTVSGGAGQGILVSHYLLTSTSESSNGFSPEVTTRFRFIQQSATVDHLSLVASDPGPMGSTSETFDVTSPFDFGVPLLFGAGTQYSLNLPSDAVPWGIKSSQNLHVTSRLELTGYSVLDRSGQAIPGAQVVRDFRTGPDVFLPEPAPEWITCAGLAILAALKKARAGAL